MRVYQSMLSSGLSILTYMYRDLLVVLLVDALRRVSS